ncbi:MAG: PcfJ domain-containing protein [Candidatus Pristimantibacillus sp.]
MSKADATFIEHKAHFGPISKGLVDYVENEVLLHSRYLFTKTELRIQYAYCTHCQQNHKPEIPLKHNSYEICPMCQSECMVKKSHVGRKYMRDKAYVVYYEKSILNPEIMTAVGFFVQRDYSGDYQNVKTLFRPSCSYVFEMDGKSTMFYTGYYDQSKWYQRKNITSEYPVYKNGTPCFCSKDSIINAVFGTPMMYSTWEHYFDDSDMTKFFGLYTKYPCVEYLTKMGYQYFVHAKLNGLRTYDAIKWSGRTIEQILKLRKQDIKQFREKMPYISPYSGTCALTLRLYQMTLKDSNRPNIDELEAIASNIKSFFPQMKSMLKYQNLRACASYIERQYSKNKRQYFDRSGVLQMWNDYMEQCKILELDLKRLEIVFPHKLHAAHESTTSQVQIKLSDIEAKRIAKRAIELEAYRFSLDGYLIRPAQSGQEIIDEGKVLRHCVGGYAQWHASGKTNILMIRKIADPNTPYFTIELKDGEIKQTYGYQHLLPSGDLIKLLDAFKTEIIKKKTRKVKPKNKAVAV